MSIKNTIRKILKESDFDWAKEGSYEPRLPGFNPGDKVTLDWDTGVVTDEKVGGEYGVIRWDINHRNR